MSQEDTFRIAKFTNESNRQLRKNVSLGNDEGELSRHSRRPLRAYLCGPIEKNCWRHALVPELRGAFCNEDGECARRDVVTELPTITPRVVCNGPWFICCDHGCAHGQGTHGTEGGGCLEDALGAQNRREVYRTNLKRISRADAVFAYIDREGAYGSTFELGHAAAIGKPLFIGFSPDAPWQDDMWFAAQAEVGWNTGHVGSVEFLWEKFYWTIGARLIAEMSWD